MLKTAPMAGAGWKNVKMLFVQKSGGGLAVRAAGQGLTVAAMLVVAGCAGSPSTSTQKASTQSGQPPARMVDNYSVSLTLAEAAERSGDLVSAATYYSQAISERKGGVKPYIRAGEILLQLGKPGQAASAFESGLAAGYKDVALHRGYGRALAWLGQADAALKEYDIALERAPNDVQAMNGRGVVLDMMDRHTEAQQQYIAAMTRAPGNLLVQNNLALSYALSGKLEDGIRLLERIESSGVATVQHRQNLALLYGLAGRTSDAERLARQDLGNERADQNLELYARMHHLMAGRTGQGAQSLPLGEPEQAQAEMPPVKKAPEDINPAPAQTVRAPQTPSAISEPATSEATIPSADSDTGRANEPVVAEEAAGETAEITVGLQEEPAPTEIPIVVDDTPSTAAGDSRPIPVESTPSDVTIVEVVVEQSAGEQTDLPVVVEPPAADPVAQQDEILIPVAADVSDAEEIAIADDRSTELAVASVTEEAVSGLPAGTIARPSNGQLRSETVAVAADGNAATASSHVPSDTGDWSVEIGPFESQAIAESTWRSIQADLKGLISGLLSNISTTPSGAILKLGPVPDFDRARRVCSEVAGTGTGCAVQPY